MSETKNLDIALKNIIMKFGIISEAEKKIVSEWIGAGFSREEIEIYFTLLNWKRYLNEYENEIGETISASDFELCKIIKDGLKKSKHKKEIIDALKFKIQARKDLKIKIK